ncbi:hypothetical protein GOP47_0011178 [Adiantum capillus-veneris]|uniref:Uncharacterized protein n=1 Tax=Adiantum capillus-veneris TaxID=13818 RepID=A0A9D4ZHD2_ADICA|nr:hypothetical protein GOP47_0011178 [Adiantum capillus-veneris]
MCRLEEGAISFLPRQTAMASSYLSAWPSSVALSASMAISLFLVYLSLVYLQLSTVPRQFTSPPLYPVRLPSKPVGI